MATPKARPPIKIYKTIFDGRSAADVKVLDSLLKNGRRLMFVECDIDNIPLMPPRVRKFLLDSSHI